MARREYTITSHHGFEHLKRVLRSEEKVFKWGFYDNKNMVFPSATPEQVEKIRAIFSNLSTRSDTRRQHYHPEGTTAYYGPTNFRFYPDLAIENFLPPYAQSGVSPAICHAATMGQNPQHTWKEGASHFLRALLQLKRAGIEVKILNIHAGEWHLWHINPPKAKGTGKPKGRR